MSGPDGPKSGDATPAKPKSAPAQGAAQKSPQEGRPSAPRYTEEMAMDRLIKHVEGKGGELGEGWKCSIHYRTDVRHRGDVYYYPPDGSKKLRSVVEVCKWLGIDTGKPEKDDQKPPSAAKRTAPKKLPREEARANAERAIEEFKLPHSTDAGTLTSLGRFDSRPKYRTKLHLFPVGLTAEHTDSAGCCFVSRISDGGDSGPSFAVSVRPQASKEEVQAATADSPDKVWQAVAKLQRQAKGGGSSSAQANLGLPSGAAPLPKQLADALKATATLDSKSGLERFCLTSQAVLHAVEGLEGVAECGEYQYVEQQHPWQTHMDLVLKQTGAKLKSGGKGTKRPRDEDTPKTGKGIHSADGRGSAEKRSRVEVTVQNVLDRLIDNIAKKEDTAMKHAQRKAEKAAKEAAQRREKEAASAAERQRKLAAFEAARAHVGLDDTQLPGGQKQPPPPKPIPGTEGLPVTAVPAVLELWELLGRFAGLLQLGECPGIEALSSAVADQAADRRDCFDTAMAAVADAITSETCSAAMEVVATGNDDFKIREHTAAILNVQEDTWPEAARRLLSLASLGQLVMTSQDPPMSGGLDIALGDYVGSSPFRNLGPTIASQGLLAGALPKNPLATVAALPVGASAAAASVRNARLDAGSLVALERCLAASSSTGSIAASSETVTTCRRIMRHIAAVKGSKDTDGLLSRAKILFFGGEQAALAAKWPRPLDLHTISIRNDLGLYSSMSNGVDVFAADVSYVCDLFQVAARNKKSGFGHTLQGKRAPEIAQKVQEALVAKLSEINSAPAPSAEKDDPEGPSDDKAAGRKEAAEDLREPLKMGDGCAVCWEETDAAKTLICDNCDQEYHMYCLDPPLTELPTQDEWFCNSCQATEGGRPGAPLHEPQVESLPQQGLTSKMDEFQAAAALLGGKESWQLSAAERAQVSTALTALFQCSGSVREHLTGNEAERKELQKELRELRAKIKREDKEREEQQKQRKDNGEVDGSRPRTRAEEAAESSALADRERVEEAVRRLREQDAGVRRDPLGHDRHWNRYWLLGNGDGGQGLLCVEESAGKLAAGGEGLDATGEAPTRWGCYPDAASVNELIAFLNPKGPREGRLIDALKKHASSFQPPAAWAPKANGVEHDESPREEAPAVPDESSAPAESSEAKPSELDVLRAELLELVCSLNLGAADGPKATPARLQQWRAFAEAVSTPQDLLAAVLLAEGFLPHERLKPWWRLWAFPTPSPALTGTAAGLKLRLRMLKSAMRKGTVALARGGGGYGRSDSADNLAPGRYSLRERRAAAGALAESALLTGGSASDNEDDESMARRLQEEEWTGRGGRRTCYRQKQPQLPPESNGARATRAAARMTSRFAEEAASRRDTPNFDGGDGGSSGESASEVVDSDEEQEVAEEGGPEKEGSGEEEERADTVLMEGRKRLRKAVK